MKPLNIMSVTYWYSLLWVVVVDGVMALVYQEVLHSILEQDNQSVFDNLMLMNKIVC
jgi:hypothetical protein